VDVFGTLARKTESNVIREGLALTPAPFVYGLSFLAQICAAATAPRVEAESTLSVVGRAACPHSDYIICKE
jgi:hypothetical protein